MEKVGRRMAAEEEVVVAVAVVRRREVAGLGSGRVGMVDGVMRLVVVVKRMVDLWRTWMPKMAADPR